MKSNRIIGFDLDGTILDHTQNKIELAKAYGYDLRPEQVVSGQFIKFVPEKIKEEIQRRLYTDPSLNSHTKLMPDSLQILQRVKASGQKYYLLSRRETNIVVPLLESLELWPQVFDETNTSFVSDMAHKDVPARRWGITHYVDDHRQTLLTTLAFIEHKFLFDPYSVLPDDPTYERLSSWEAVGRRLLD